MNVWLQLILPLFIIAVAISIRVLADRLDRNRIRDHVESAGGKVLDITWNPLGLGWWGTRDRIYDVRYTTLHGASRTATCKTSMFGGVNWTLSAPPGFPEPDTTGEAITCLSCGAKIAARQTRCPQCGWSQTGHR